MSDDLKNTRKDKDEFYFKEINSIIKKRHKDILNKEVIISFFRKLILIILVLYIIFKLIFGLFVVYNDDMFPKMVPSDLLIYYRLDRDFYVGDVVVLHEKSEDESYVLRIVARGGDEVDISTEGELIVNGSYQAESEIFYKTDVYDTDVKFPLKLKADEVFALGDMRKGAKDSRYFGAINKEEVKGKVFSLFRRANF